MMSKERIENGFEEKYGRPMNKQERDKMNKNRKLTRSIKGKKDHKRV